ncbi:hypothetical protein HPP92_004555 [Vanilla planifolia]|uniref:Uncharacterized protein n=1 Tax=Vanilla planifolia TaxID=51239 RepID=A0A835RRQ6_VANPL|nr:hypothetical protein HPP92_004926 [Vanilla planifolia]KAG0493561.1 hypothetical protein HPP92_004555 [Vanilla planifolia]
MSKEEDEIIIKLQTSVGNRWSFIARHLPGRTDNDIKNYWNSHLSRRLHRFRHKGDGEVVIVDLGTVPGGHKRESRCRVEVEEPERHKSAVAEVEDEKMLCSGWSASRPCCGMTTRRRTMYERWMAAISRS